MGSAKDEYPLTIGGFNGIAPTDPFAYGGYNGKKFSTYDNDNDQKSSGNCARRTGDAVDNGGWWYTDERCWAINLNNKYDPAQFWTILLANAWHKPTWTEMKIHSSKCIPIN